MKCLNIVFELKRGTFGCIFSSKKLIREPKIKIFCQIFVHFRGKGGIF